MPIRAEWKGKRRTVELDDRDVGTGGKSGIVLSLEEVITGVYDVAYTLPVNIGTTNQKFSLQVDTGSSDLWIASTSCSTSSCNQAKGHLYDPRAATPTGATFSIPYLAGSAAGPIVLDSVSIGGYGIDRQALAAVTEVNTEPLAPSFNGILGLALPLNSIIASTLSHVTTNTSEGATWASNLFSLAAAPSSPFLSLALSRPGSDQVPAVLGIGRHPASLIPDPSLIHYSTPLSDSGEPGALFWKPIVTGITVYVNGVAKRMQLGLSNTGAAFPNAVLDSGTPLIFTTTTIANAIYGAIGITPANDGMYYVPCTTPLNMTITLDTRPEIPLHPLDLTAQASQGQLCTGLIQAADAQLSSPASSKTDIVLGVPFMRNVYTVMAYSVPNRNGSFTGIIGGSSRNIAPSLGLLSLTDPTKALQEFYNVRVLNQALGGNASTTNGHSSASTVNLGGKRVSVGIVVLIALLSFFGLCGLLFVMRWLFFRRRKQREAAAEAMDQAGEGDFGMDQVAYMLTRTSSSRSKRLVGLGGYDGPSEDDLRRMRFHAYMQKERVLVDSTMSSSRTRVGGYEPVGYGKVHDDEEGVEFGLRSPTRKVMADDDLVWDPATGLDWGDNTLTQHPPREYEIPPEPPEDQNLANSHRRNSSLAMQPLLPAQCQAENDRDNDEYGVYTRYLSPNGSTSQRRFHQLMISTTN